jgi:chemotaxis protein MotB
MGKKKQEAEQGGDSFVVLFCGLMILILAFFIVLNSMAVLSEANRRKALASLIGTFGVPMGRQMMRLVAPSADAEQIEEQLQQQIQQLGKKFIPNIIDEIQRYAMAEYVDFAVAGANIEITIDSAVMFQPGDDTLLPEVYPILDAIAKKALDLDCPVLIEGHTDSAKIHNPRFPSNWELSALRALAVQSYLVRNQNFPVYQIVSFGYADTRPIAPNDTPENRTKNRRVQITFLGVGASSKPTGLKTWWERIGVVNPFDSVKKD